VRNGLFVLFAILLCTLGAITGCAFRIEPTPNAALQTAVPIATFPPLTPPATVLPAPAPVLTLPLAPNIPARDVGQTLCFACHGPGELPSQPDHSVLADGRAVCQQCHTQAK
jgi:hypothetical protein